MPLKKYKLAIELFYFWIFPFLALWLSFQFISQHVSSVFATFLVLFPALTMYLVVGTGAGYCKFWYFDTRYSIAGVLPTIGLLYSAVMNLITCLLLYYLLAQNQVFFVVFASLISSLSGTFIDIFLLGSGLFYIKSKKYPKGSNPIKHAFSYGFTFFGIAGFANALGVSIGFYQLEISKNWVNPTYAILILAPIIALPFVIYFLFLLRKNNAQKLAINN
jgi:hypothetical protein